MTYYSVPVSSMPLLQDPPFVLWLCLLALGLGRLLLRALRVTGEELALERSILALALGFGLLQYVAFALGMMGWLTSRAVWMSLGMLSLLLLPSAALALQSLPRHLRTVCETRLSPLAGRVTLIVVLPLTLAFILALTPPTDADGLYYHLTAPKRWLQWSNLQYLPTLVHSNGLLGVNMLYTLAMAVWSDTAAKLIHFTLGVLALFAIFALGRQLRDATTGMVAAACWFIGLSTVPTLDAARLFSWAYVDLGVAMYVTCAVLAWLLWSRRGTRGLLLVSALCAGFATTTKLNAIFAGAALTVVVYVDGLRQHRNHRATLIDAMLFGVVALLPTLPWLWRSFELTGSPLYLMLPKWFATRDWPPQAGAAFSEYFKFYVWGTGYRSLSWSLEMRQTIRAAVLLLTAGVAALTCWRLKSWEHRCITFVFAVLVFGSITGTGLYARYLVPFLPLAIIIAVTHLQPLLTRRVWAQSGLLLVLTGSAILYIRDATMAAGDTMRVVTGRMSRSTYLERHLPIYELADYANQVVPQEGHILMAGSRPSYYFNAYCFLTEAYYQARIRLDTYDNFRADLHRDRISYVVLPDSNAPSALIGPTYAPVINEIPFVQRLVHERGQLLAKAGSDSLYHLEP